MLETFKARLKAKALAAGANLSQKRIDAIADRLHKKFPDLTDESEHDAKLDDYYDADVIKDIAKQDDKVRTLEAKPKDEPKPADNPAPAPAPKPADDMPAWFKVYQEENDKKINALLAEKQQSSIQQQLAANEKLKGIDKRLWEKWKLPEKEEDIDTFAEEVATHFADFQLPAKDGNNQPFVPGKGAAGGGKGKQPSDKELDGILSNIKI
jgi:hypothetical protein